MKNYLYLTLSILLNAYSSSAQDLTLVAEECSEECPSFQAADIFEMFRPYFGQAFRDSQSGTVNAHEEGGWIVQTREKQADGCYQYCTQFYRASAGNNCFYEKCFIQLGFKPAEDKNTRVVANFHTHPYTVKRVEDLIGFDDLIDPVDGNVEFDGYEFSNIDYDQPRFEYVCGPSEVDKILSVKTGIPGITLCADGGNETIRDGSVYGFEDYLRDEDGNIIRDEDGKILGVDEGSLIVEPQNLSWECEACVEISPVEDCLDTEESITLEATVKGPEDKAVSWEAQEGSIDDEGNYQAPPFSATDMVIATSKADENAKDTTFIEIGCDCFWEANLSGDINGTYSGEIAVYLNSGGQLKMSFLSGPSQNDYPKLGVGGGDASGGPAGGPVPIKPDTLTTFGFSFTVGAQGPFLAGGGAQLSQEGFPVQIVIEQVGDKMLAGRIQGTIGGKTNPMDPLDESFTSATIDMTFRARLQVEGQPYPCDVE